MELIVSHPRWGDIDLDPEEVERRMADHDPLTAGDAARSFYEAYAAQEGKPRWGDKSPPYTWKARRIQRALPEAHFIHLIRDGRDVALSLSEVSWGPGDVQAAAAKWVEELGSARRRAQRLRPGTYMEVRYEDLVADPEPLLRRIADFVDLPWDGGMLDYHRGAEERMKDGDPRLPSAGRRDDHGRGAQAPARAGLEPAQLQPGRAVEDRDVGRGSPGVRERRRGPADRAWATSSEHRSRRAALWRESGAYRHLLANPKRRGGGKAEGGGEAV